MTAGLPACQSQKPPHLLLGAQPRPLCAWANGLGSRGGARPGGRSEARGRGGGGQRGSGGGCRGGGGWAECPRVVGGWGLRAPALGGGGDGRECRAGVRVRDAGWSAAVSVGRRRWLRPRRLRLGAGVTRGGRPRGAVQGPGGPRGGSERKRCGCGLRWEPGRGPWGS